VLVGTRLIEFDIKGFLIINLVLVAVWTALAVYLVRENRRWRERAPAPSPRPV
jgi:hypothetical protein